MVITDVPNLGLAAFDVRDRSIWFMDAYLRPEPGVGATCPVDLAAPCVRRSGKCIRTDCLSTPHTGGRPPMLTAFVPDLAL
jgi:hypothetical protein